MNMDRQIRKLGIALALCFVALFGQLNRVQFWGAQAINDKPGNSRQEQRRFNQPRGSIFTVDGVELARSVEQGEGIRFRREYPEGSLFGPVTGYYSFNLGSSGVESSYGDELSGTASSVSMSSITDLFNSDDRYGNVVLTLSAAVQRVASEQLGQREGSVVAFDPRSGAIDAMVSFPTFDPTELVTNNQAAIDVKTVLDADREKPLLFRAYREIFFPGSTFKVITGAVATDRGTIRSEYPRTSTFDIDFSETDLGNYDGGACGGDLNEMLRVSCNTGFAQMGVDLGGTNMAAGAEAFGFNQDVPIDMPAPARSVFPSEFPRDEGNGPVARASIGQGDVSATPLLMAMVAGAIANNGSMVTPHVMDHITDQDGDTVETYEPTEWRRATSPDAAAAVREGMLITAREGTGSGLLIDGMEVGAKTGTAQLGTDPPRSHAWIIGFAGPPGQAPVVAVAVLVEGQPGEANENTGGRVAAPIAKAVMEAVLAQRGTE